MTSGHPHQSAESREPLRVLSLGAGVQSTTVLLMSLRGEIEPFDGIVFADTQAEPAEVYAHLALLEVEAERASVPLVRVTAGSLTDRLLDPTRRDGIQIPAFIAGLGGQRDGILRRQCTERFKSRPVYKWLNGWRDKRHVVLTLGISWDELERTRTAQRKWVTNEYPLVDLRMTRVDCKRWLHAAGWSAPRSACTYCPYHGDEEWRRLRDDHPEDFAEAVRVDAGMRKVHAERIAAGVTTLTGTPYVHRRLIPLADVDIRSLEDKGQGTMFGEECGGWCGL